MSDLRARIAEVLISDAFGMTTQTAALRQADAVIRELNLAIPCATTGCRMRQITRAASDLGATQ